VIDLLDSSYALPRGIESVKPNLIFVLQSIVVNVEFPYGWDDLLRRIHEIVGRRGYIPRCVGRRTAGKLTPLFYRENGRDFWSCVWERRRNNGRVRRY
jgi:hypothetical protein